MKCEYCEIIERKKEIIYEDEDLVVAVKDDVFTPGQVTVFPKKHFTIMELVPEDILQKCALVANKVGVVVFEALSGQGTNIFIQNGLAAGQKVPHFGIEVIPRQENDGLNFQWEPRELMEDDLKITFNQLKNISLEDFKSASRLAAKPDLNLLDSENKENDYFNLSARRESKADLKMDLASGGKKKEPEQVQQRQTEKKDSPNYLLRSIRKIP